MTRRRIGSRFGTGPLVALVALCSLVGWPADGAGQIIVNHAALDPARPNTIQVRTGVDYGFVAGFGYGRTLRIGSRNLLLSGSATALWADADTRDYGVRVGATIDLLGWERWRLVGGLGGNVEGTSNTLGRLTSLGAGGVLVGGYWSPRWFLAGEGGYEGAIATHIEHTAHYRATFHPEARDGWYVDTAANIHLGLVGGISFDRHDLVLRAGQARDREGNDQLLPAYASFEVNWRF